VDARNVLVFIDPPVWLVVTDIIMCSTLRRSNEQVFFLDVDEFCGVGLSYHVVYGVFGVVETGDSSLYSCYLLHFYIYPHISLLFVCDVID
jgi:hypothetical protein